MKALRDVLADLRASERASELVEMALVLPLLMMLLLGIFYFGHAYNVYETVTRAAREGARVALAQSCSSCGNALPSSATVDTAINDSLSASSLDPTLVNPPITITYNNINTDDPAGATIPGAVVSFGYPVTVAIPFTTLNTFTFTIHTTVQMRQDQ
jgi:Flp pilus assembly protein TadG